VRPVVTLRRPPRRGAARARVKLRGTVKPRKARVYQVLQLKRRSRYRNVGVKALRTRRGGAFDGSFVPASAGVYRFYVATKSDESHARGASDYAVVRVGRAARAVRGGAKPR